MKKLVFLVFILCSFVILNGCSKEEITITFNSNGGNQIEPIILNELDLNGLPTPVRVGYTFIGWFLDKDLDESIGKHILLTSSTTLYAKWEINIYKITFESNGGPLIDDLELPYGSEILMNNTPIREGFIFEGWYDSLEFDHLFDHTVMPSEDLIVYAKWIDEGVSIIFDSQGGTEIETMIGLPGAPLIEPPHPTREGFIFAGWFISLSSVDRYDFDTMPEETTTLYANWGTIGLAYELIHDDQAYEVGVGDAYEESSIVIPKYYQDKKVTRIMDFGFSDAENMNIVDLPETIIEIGNRSFMDAFSLNHIHLPDRLEIIGSSAFRNCYSLEAIHVTEQNQFFISIDGILLSKNLETLIRYPQGKSQDSYIIPNHVITIGEDAFSGVTNLTSLELGSGVTTIKTHAFYKTGGITSLVIPDHVTTVEFYAFRDFHSLESISLGSGITLISSYLFDGCISLTSIVIPYPVVSIGYGAFSYCSNLRSIYIVRTSINGMITGALFMFSNTPSNLIIYFPDQATVNDYKLANFWSSFASKMQVGTP